MEAKIDFLINHAESTEKPFEKDKNQIHTLHHTQFECIRELNEIKPYKSISPLFHKDVTDKELLEMTGNTL